MKTFNYPPKLNAIWTGRQDAAVCSADFSLEEAVRRYHRSIPGYAETPLVRLSGLAAELGVADVFVKDESKRFGLNAFKVLGASYAMARVIAGEQGLDPYTLTFERLTEPSVRERLEGRVFATATDGNHGRGVAWTARRLGCGAVVYMPKGAAVSRVKAIEAEGAEVIVTDLNYDDAVRLACSVAEEKGWTVVQDTAWEGYENIPEWIAFGYSTMAAEAHEQIRQYGAGTPSHLFLQAGVGAMAGAVLGYYSKLYRSDTPLTTIMEPRNAACVFESVRKGSGEAVSVGGNLVTMMAGLACGEPNPLTWPVLRDRASAYLSCADDFAARGMRMLAHPFDGDPPVVSGESGAVGIGVLWELMKNPVYADLRNSLGLGRDSSILLFSTEGDTDPENYIRIVSQP